MIRRTSPVRLAAAVTGAAALLVALSGCSLIERARDLVDRAGEPTYSESGEAGDTAYFDLEPGDCFDDEDYDGSVYSADCGGDHYQEVYALLPAEGEYPGDVETHKLGLLGCIDAFDDYVGRPFAESSLDYWFFSVDRAHWVDGEPAIVCYAYDWEGYALPSTVRDSGL